MSLPSWRHPELGPISPLLPKLRAKKVWKHFYAQRERWERISELDPRPLAREVASMCGVDPQEVRELPKAALPFRELLEEHHDNGYGPTYLSEMQAEETRWSTRPSSAHRCFALTPNAIFLVVQLDRAGCFVLSAYRPTLRFGELDWSEDQYRDHARGHYERNLIMSRIDAFAHSSIERLERALARPLNRPAELWELAVAAGYAREISAELLPAELLEQAESRLEGASSQLSERCAGSLLWDQTLEEIRSAIGEGSLEDLERALLGLEELLLGAAELGLHERSEAELHAAIPILAGISGSLRQAARLGLWLEWGGEGGRRARALWSAIPTRWEIEATLSSLARDAAAELGQWLQECLAGLDVVAPAPTMGATEEAPWSVETDSVLAPEGRTLRLFIVDDEHPEGYEVSELLGTSPAVLWQLEEPEQEALAVAVLAVGDLRGEDLSAILEQAQEDASILVASRALSRPR